MTDTLDISADEFRLWLEARRGDIVGRPCWYRECPISVWLRERGDDFVAVRSTTLCRNGNEEILPSWARRFISEVDRGRDPVDGETALSILAGALRSP